MGTYTLQQRMTMSKMDPPQALPDGSNPIANVSDLKDAISTYGLNKNKVAAKAWIIKRAQQLNAVSSLPDSWNVSADSGKSSSSSSSAQHAEVTLDDFLKHSIDFDTKLSDL